MSTANQAYVFLTTVYAGIIVGLFYDLIRTVRKILKPGKWITAIIDLIFWIIVSFFLLAVLFLVNDGEIRFYCLIGMAMGWVLYLLTLSIWIMRFLFFLYKLIIKLFKALAVVIKWPVQMAGRILDMFGRLFVKPLLNIYKKENLEKMEK